MLPVMIMLLLGAADLARAFYLNIETAGASRAGTRAGISGDTVDIGDFIRSEPNTAIPNTVAAWGDTGPGGANANCTAAVSSQRCGDPNGCPSTAFTGTRVACFAVRNCKLNGATLDVGYPCQSLGNWGTRPGVSAGVDSRGLVVVVVYKFTPVTPVVTTVVGLPGGSLTLRSQSVGLELYY
jgi:Flp pilus assembly protein TadG